MIFQISYDLKSTTADYSVVYEKIRSFGEALPILKSTWLVSTNKTAGEMTDELQSVIQKGDRFFISEVAIGKYNGWHSSTTWDWIKQKNSDSRGSNDSQPAHT